MPAEHCEKRKRLPITASVAVIPFLRTETGFNIVLGQRADNDKWMPVGGGIEQGEMPLQALKREWQEETGSKFSECVNLILLPPDTAASPREGRTSLGLIYFGEYVGNSLPRPQGRELVKLQSFTPQQLRVLLEQYKTSLYRPDLNYELLCALLGTVSQAELSSLFLLTKARAKTREISYGGQG